MGQSASAQPVVTPPKALDDMPAAQAQAALEYAAAYLHRRRCPMQLVATGEVINTLYLRDRTSTHDVIFFASDHSPLDWQILRAAIADATHKTGAPPNWLHNQTHVSLTQAVRLRLVRNAVQCGTIVFQAPGLKLFAAPWEYALCSKLDCMKRVAEKKVEVGGRRDEDDAIAYLNQIIIRRTRRAPVTRETIGRWMAQYDLQYWDQGVTEIAELYMKVYQRPGIS